MSLKVREWLNKNSAPVTIVSIFLLIMALGAIVWQMKPTQYEYEPVDVWYYDLNTGELFPEKSNRIPPVETPSGPVGSQDMPAGVRAYVFSCGECTRDEMYIGWLEMFTKEAKEKIEATRQGGEDGEYVPDDMMMMEEMMWEEGQLIQAGKTLDVEEELKSGWVSQNSDPAFMIMEVAQGRCGEERYPQTCLPDRE